jgi:hypothetical protein
MHGLAGWCRSVDSCISLSGKAEPVGTMAAALIGDGNNDWAVCCFRVRLTNSSLPCHMT